MKKQQKIVIATATLLLFMGSGLLFKNSATITPKKHQTILQQNSPSNKKKTRINNEKKPNINMTEKEKKQIQEIIDEESSIIGDLTSQLLGKNSSNQLVGLLDEDVNETILNLVNNKPKPPVSLVPDEQVPNEQVPNEEAPINPPVIDPGIPPVIPPIMESVPEIHVTSSAETVIEKYLPFDVGNYFYVTDALDKNPTVTIDGQVDIYTNGKQSVTINVVNKFGNRASKTLFFYVNARPILKPIQSGTIDIQIDSDVSFYSLVHAVDEEDGDISGAIEIIKNTVDRKKEGTGTVEYKVTDSKGYSSFETVQINVTNHAPVFTFDKNDKHEINQEFNPLEGVTLNDREDGQIDVVEQMIISNTVDVTKEGTYTVTYKAKDSHGKASSIQKRIVKVENEAPVIHGAANKMLHVKDQLSKNILLKDVSATDREDNKLGLEMVVTLDNDQFNAIRMDTEGDYELTYKTTDSMGKITTETITVTVVNDAPVITGVRDIVKLNVGDSFDPLEGVSASDTETESQQLTIKVDGLTPEGTIDTSVPGTHKLMYSTEDEHGKRFEIGSTVEVEAEETKESFIYPLTTVNSSSPMGERTNPITGEKEFHRGHDFGANFGTDILAVADGVVIASNVHESWGEYVVIRHENGYTSLYAHQSKRQVIVGQAVKQGDTIGLVGSTGDSTGPHLHLEMSSTGEWNSLNTSHLIDIDNLIQRS